MKKRFISRLGLGILIIIVAWYGYYLAPVIALVLAMPSCDEDSEAVTYARSLTQERLEKLYYDMEKFSTIEGIPNDGYHLYDETEKVTHEFTDLKVGVVRPAEGRITVEGCLDHYVFLKFEGFHYLRKNGSKRQIVLTWGERPPDAGSQVLWTEKK